MQVETKDVVALLKSDHQMVGPMLARLDTIEDAELIEYFCLLREELVRHEADEEPVVYPAFRRNLRCSEAVADAASRNGPRPSRSWPASRSIRTSSSR